MTSASRATIVLLVLTLTAACTPAEKPEAVLEALYAAHKPQNDRDVDLGDKQQLSRYFSPALTALFLRDAECVERTKEVCNLGFDPIFAAQDFGNEELNLVIEPAGTNKFKVTFTNLTRRSLIYEVVKTDAGWRIDDIVYPEGPTLKALLSTPAS